FAARDPGGLSDSTVVRIHVDNVDRPPTLGVSNHGTVVGQTLRFTLSGTDPDAGTTLTYSASGLPSGAVLDPGTGQLTWTPTPFQPGDSRATSAIPHGGLTPTRAALLRAPLTPVPPAVLIALPPSFPAVPEQPVLVHAVASSLSPVTGLTMTIDGQPVTV